jgi:hypothetical protein
MIIAENIIEIDPNKFDSIDIQSVSWDRIFWQTNIQFVKKYIKEIFWYSLWNFLSESTFRTFAQITKTNKAPFDDWRCTNVRFKCFIKNRYESPAPPIGSIVFFDKFYDKWKVKMNWWHIWISAPWSTWYNYVIIEQIWDKCKKTIYDLENPWLLWFFYPVKN